MKLSFCLKYNRCILPILDVLKCDTCSHTRKQEVSAHVLSRIKLCNFSIELRNGLVFCLADRIGVEASKAIHVGDDETADKAGANAIGLDCWYAKSFSFWFLPHADVMFQSCRVFDFVL